MSLKFINAKISCHSGAWRTHNSRCVYSQGAYDSVLPTQRVITPERVALVKSTTRNGGGRSPYGFGYQLPLFGLIDQTVHERGLQLLRVLIAEDELLIADMIEDTLTAN